MPGGDQSTEMLQYNSQGWQKVESRVITEAAVTLSVNGEPWLSFHCTPTELEELAVGFLFNEGVIHSIDQVAHVRPCDNGSNVDVWLRQAVDRPTHWQRTSGCSGGVTGPDTLACTPALAPDELRISPQVVLRSMELLFAAQELYRQTRGIHCSALTDGEKLYLRAEDIGRHNTLDKLAGMLLNHPLSFQPRVIVTTGRVSSEMLQKSARLGAVLVISRTAASSKAVALAHKLGITLVGYARRNQFNVYAHPERLLDEQPSPAESSYQLTGD